MIDPYPWRVEVIDRTNDALIAARDGERLADPGWATFWDRNTERLIFDPRPTDRQAEIEAAHTLDSNGWCRCGLTPQLKPAEDRQHLIEIAETKEASE